MQKALFHITKRANKYLNYTFLENYENTNTHNEFSNKIDEIIEETRRFYDISAIMNNKTLNDIDLTKKVQEISRNLLLLVSTIPDIYKECAISIENWEEESDEEYL